MIASRTDFRISTELETALKSLRVKAGVIGVIFLALTILGAFIDTAQFFRSYLWSYVFWMGLSLGCLAWLMTQYLTGGAWGVMIRRIAEAASKTLPVWLLLFIPIIFGIHSLFG